jgi:hypothetical protein
VKVTNISSKVLYLNDLKITNEAQTEGRRGEECYLRPGNSVYLQNTSGVLRSAFKGTIKTWKDLGYIELEDTISLAAGGTTILNHRYGYPPVVYILKQVGVTWVDATGTADIIHRADPLDPLSRPFMQTTITNTTVLPLTFMVRLV